VLQALFAERLAFAPFDEGPTRGYQFFGTGSYGGLLVADTYPCAFHLFVLSASCRPPQVFVMQSTDARHLHHSALTRQMYSPRLGCVF
jgi:hypothetical protein